MKYYFSKDHPDFLDDGYLGRTNITIDDVKNAIAFKGEIGETLRSLVDCWYNIKLKQGCSKQDSIFYAMDNLGKKLDEFNQA